jgi:hypothetical protein
MIGVTKKKKKERTEKNVPNPLRLLFVVRAAPQLDFHAAASQAQVQAGYGLVLLMAKVRSDAGKQLDSEERKGKRRSKYDTAKSQILLRTSGSRLPCEYEARQTPPPLLCSGASHFGAIPS